MAGMQSEEGLLAMACAAYIAGARLHISCGRGEVAGMWEREQTVPGAPERHLNNAVMELGMPALPF